MAPKLKPPRICRICGLSEHTNGVWCDRFNPIYFSDKVYYANNEASEGHAICLKLEAQAKLYGRSSVLTKAKDKYRNDKWVYVNRMHISEEE
tara:strand:- start:10 stop:285 length:276 start_codon:yes stop_codon:yes gene_type:complete